MKTSLKYFPEFRQAELKVIANILALRFPDVEMIILINPHDIRNGYELLIIMSDKQLANDPVFAASLSVAIQQKQFYTLFSILCKAIDLVNMELLRKNSFYTSIRDNGILLFSSGRVRLAI